MATSLGKYVFSPFRFDYLTTLLVLQLYNVDDRMINERRELAEWKLTKEPEVLREYQLQKYCVHHKYKTNRVLTRAAAIGRRRLTAWDMVNLSLCLTKQYAVMAYGGVDV
jgi:hypothetical protein